MSSRLHSALNRWVAIILLGLIVLNCSLEQANAQAYGRDTLEAIGPYLEGIFPASTPGENGAPQPPALLSQTGAFTELATLTPRDGLLPYQVNSPLWTDGATKQRWIAVPNDGIADTAAEKIIFSAMDSWSFPVGTVIVKEFDLPVDARDPSVIRRVETRFIVVASDGSIYGVTYQWREDGSEADLLLGGASAEIEVTSANGTISTQTWAYPSRQDCLSCHNPSAGYVLGLRTHQINGDLAYPDTSRTDNQLRAMNHLGLFSPAIDETAIPSFLKSVPVDDTSATLEHRVRSYLDANCSQCHRPGTLATSFDTRFTTPFEQQNIVGGLVLYDLGVPEARVVSPQSIERSILHRRVSALGLHQMPPIGRNLVDAKAVSSISNWIFSLPVDPGGGDENRSPVAQDDEASTVQGEFVEIPVLSNDADLDDDLLVIDSFTSPANGSVVLLANNFARYTPNGGFLGTDTFTYILTDDRGGISNQATVTIRVLSNTNASAITFLDRSSRLSIPSNASGVAMGVADMDQDGLDDIVHLHLAKTLRVDYQEPNGAEFVGQTSGSAYANSQWGLCIADADDNGYPDILNGGYYDNLHLRWNNGGRTAFDLVDLTSPRVFLQTVNFADINGDGLLDIFACHDVGDNAKFRNTGGRNFVYDNGMINTKTTPSSDNSGSYGTVWTDYDNDGDLDMYLSKCRSGVSSPTDPRRINMFFRNNGNGTYTNVAAALSMAFGQQSWAADFADIDNDGDLDCFVGNHGDPSLVMRNNGNGTFTDGTAASGINVNWRVIQTVFRDFNNDAWVDLLLVGDRHQLWLNDRDGTYTLAPNPLGSLPIETCAVGDLNHDGYTDVYAGYGRVYNTPRSDRPDKLLLASPNGNGFLSVGLEGASSNKSAVGARLELHGPWGIQVREVRGGESYGISHSLTQIFGLGNAASIDKLKVRWPSGSVDEIFNLAPNQFLKLREGGSGAPSLINPGPQANQVSESVTLAINASDPTADVLSFAAVNLPNGLSIDQNTGLISGTIAGNSAGNYSVIVQASDSWNTIFQPFSWEVRPLDTAPAVVVSTETASVSGAFVVTVRFTSAVTDLTLSEFNLNNGSASAFSGSGTTYQFTVTPTAPGTVTVSLPADAAFDSGARGNLVSNVLPVVYALPFTPPTITAFAAAPVTIPEGDSTTLAWSIDDGGTPLTALTITPSMGSMLGQSEVGITPAATTTYTITATNSVGADTAETTVTVDRPLPIEDSLANLVAPGSVAHGETVTLSIDYAATVPRELWVWLQDSNDNWRTATQGNIVLAPGFGTHTFSLGIDAGSRIGDGYVWAVRLLPPGWVSADDALAEEFSLSDMQSGTLPPDTDLLGAIDLPAIVKTPGTVTLAVPYQATARREIRVWLHDSQNGWFTVTQGNTTVDPGGGTYTFTLSVITGAREGDGYVWAVRMLPLGWTVADDALDASYGNVTMERNTGGPATQDILTNIEAPGTVQPASIVTVSAEYEVTERRDLGIWLHDSTDNWRTAGHGLAKVEPGIGTQSFNIGVVGDARIGAGYIWAVRLLPEGWENSDEAFDAFYKDAAVEESTNDFINLAVLPEASASQSSVYGAAFGADLARDGNADGDWRNGSVSHTELDVDGWWEVDLGSVRAVDHILLWNRTDCCGDRLAPYHVFVSNVPFVSANVNEVLSQAGVSHFSYTEVPLPTQRVDVNRTGRYVRIQLTGANYLSLAEVEVYGSLGGALVNGLTYSYYEGTWTQLPDFEALSPLQTGTLTNADLSARARDDFFAIRYRGCLSVPTDGDYTLSLNSDEGSRLYLNGGLVVDNDGAHEVTEVSGTVTLTAGLHPLEIQYFERDGAETLELYWEGPGIVRERIPNTAVTVNETGANLGFHHVGRRVPANDNADGDLLDLTAEYALGRNPYVASMKDVGIQLVAQDDGTRLTVTYDRPANQASIDYWLEVSADLQQWTPILVEDDVENVTYGWERVHYDHLEDKPGVSLEKGFVRLRIWHHDWNHETTTPICGWYQTTFHSGYQTHGVSLNASPIYASTIAEVDLDEAQLTMTSGGLLESLDSQGLYYLELTNGRYEGHRIDINVSASTEQLIALNLDGDFNTLSSLPETGMRFSQVVIRPHRTLGDVYAPARFHGSNDPAAADQLQFFNGQSFEGYFLLDGGGRRHWAQIADTDLNDENQTIIPPGVGTFIKRAPGTNDASLLVVGHLRDHDFMQPLRQGYNLLAPITPMASSPSSRGLSLANGFLGSTDPNSADQVQLWLGDWIEGGQGYQGYFLLDAGETLRYWTGSNDELLTNEDSADLFQGNRAFFFDAAIESHENYRVPGAAIQRAR